MGKRVTIEVASILGITIALALVGLMIVTAGDAAASGDVLPNAARFLFGGAGIALGLWVILLIAGGIILRFRPVGVRIGVHLLSAVVSVGANTALFALAAGAGGGGWSDLIIAVALSVGAVVLIAAIVGVLVTELAIMRPRRLERSAPARPVD